MTTSLFPAFRTTDSARTIALLEALGFTERLIIRDASDPAFIEHAEFAWGENAGIMFGSTRGDGSGLDATGGSAAYLVAGSDAEVDRLHEVAAALGLEISRSPADKDYGGRGFDFRDHDGNSWSIGSYRGA